MPYPRRPGAEYSPMLVPGGGGRPIKYEHVLWTFVIWKAGVAQQ